METLKLSISWFSRAFYKVANLSLKCYFNLFIAVSCATTSTFAVAYVFFCCVS